MSSDILELIDEAVEEAISEQKLPGAVVLIARHGKIAFAKAYGNRAVEPKKVPMTIDTVFDLASLTKVIATAPSVLLLAERGRLRLDDPVSKYISAFGKNGKSHVTIRQLLTHHSGLMADNQLSDYRHGYKTSMKKIYALSLEGRPGHDFIYSDINYILLGEIVKRVSGQRLDKFARKNIFQPAGMTSTDFKPSGRLRSRCAPTIKQGKKWLIGYPHDPRANLLGGVAGHAGLFSTAGDLARYCQMILNGGSLGETRILKRQTVEEMIRVNSPPDSRAQRGLGWDIHSTYSAPRGELFSPESFGHTGYTGTSIWIDPVMDTFVIILSNRVHPYETKANLKELRAEVSTIAASAIIDSVGPQ